MVVVDFLAVFIWGICALEDREDRSVCTFCFGRLGWLLVVPLQWIVLLYRLFWTAVRLVDVIILFQWALSDLTCWFIPISSSAAAFHLLHVASFCLKDFVSPAEKECTDASIPTEKAPFMRISSHTNATEPGHRVCARRLGCLD